MGASDLNLVKTQVLEAVFDWPLPPFYRVAGNLSQPGVEHCEIEFRDGSTSRGHVRRVKPAEGACLFQLEGAAHWRRIEFSGVRLFRLPRPLEIEPDGRSEPSVTERAVQSFTIEFSDGACFAGQTVSHERTAFGLYLYPIVAGGRVQRVFVPDSAIGGFNVGELIGELLVREQAATENQVQVALEEQSNLRQQRLGDLLVEQKVVTREELELALKHQETMPVMRLGEAILQLGMAGADQIDAALARQKSQRNVPLGQILIEMGVVDESQMKEVLAKKLGIPFVSLDQYPVDLNAVRLVGSAFAYKHMVLPLYSTATDIVIALEQPLQVEVLNHVRFLTGLRPVPVMAVREQLRKRISDCYARTNDGAKAMTHPGAVTPAPFAPAENSSVPSGTPHGSGADELASLLFAEGLPHHETAASEETVKDADTVLVQFVNQMIVDAFEGGASDIHVETYPGRQNSRIRFRKDGVMRDYLQIPSNFRAALISRIKIMAALDISERRRPQDGKMEFTLPSGRKLELRLATIPTNSGLEDAVMRLLASANALPLDALDLGEPVCGTLKGLADKSFGLILVCGPTGSGKTTSLHALLAHMNTAERKIWTAEDPVEITQPGLRQVQMQHKIGWDFSTALRAFMRADPDVIMVGEMRDAETAKVGVEASLTGHIVLSTLHTNSAAESVTRLLDLGLEPFSFADALLGVLAQRLVRKLCLACKASHAGDQLELRQLAEEYCAGTALEPGARFETWKDEGTATLYRAVGCKKCGGTGYQGRTGLYELLVNDATVRRQIQSRAAVTCIAASAAAAGMRSLKQDGIRKVLAGVTDIKQVRAVCN